MHAVTTEHLISLAANVAAEGDECERIAAAIIRNDIRLEAKPNEVDDRSLATVLISGAYTTIDGLCDVLDLDEERPNALLPLRDALEQLAAEGVDELDLELLDAAHALATAIAFTADDPFAKPGANVATDIAARMLQSARRVVSGTPEYV